MNVAKVLAAVVDQEVDSVAVAARAAAEGIIKVTTTIEIATVIKLSFSTLSFFRRWRWHNILRQVKPKL